MNANDSITVFYSKMFVSFSEFYFSVSMRSTFILLYKQVFRRLPRYFKYNTLRLLKWWDPDYFGSRMLIQSYYFLLFH